MRKAIFLDRDGVINIERKDYVKNIDEFSVIDGVPETIKILKERDFLVIVITNQSAINRKLLSIQTLNEIHSNFQNFLKKFDTYIDGFYFCPHLPDENCSCRKPKPGMLINAIKDFNIDTNNSVMIGNSMSDIQAAQAVGCHGILLEHDKTLIKLVNELISSGFLNQEI